jgi:hypothetical protein
VEGSDSDVIDLVSFPATRGQAVPSKGSGGLKVIRSERISWRSEH